MLRKMARAKIHRATVTRTDIDYKGSIGIDKRLLEASGILPNEMVLVLNYKNGVRFETYVIKEEEQGTIALYGPAAKLAEVGDEVIILSSALCDDKEAAGIKLKVIKVNKENKQQAVETY